MTEPRIAFVVAPDGTYVDLITEDLTIHPMTTPTEGDPR